MFLSFISVLNQLEISNKLPKRRLSLSKLECWLGYCFSSRADHAPTLTWASDVGLPKDQVALQTNFYFGWLKMAGNSKLFDRK